MAANDSGSYYTKCSDATLLQVAEAVNRATYPDTWAAISCELKKRGLPDPLDIVAVDRHREEETKRLYPPDWEPSSLTACQICNGSLVAGEGGVSASRRCSKCELQWITRRYLDKAFGNAIRDLISDGNRSIDSSSSCPSLHLFTLIESEICEHHVKAHYCYDCSVLRILESELSKLRESSLALTKQEGGFLGMLAVSFGLPTLVTVKRPQKVFGTWILMVLLVCAYIHTSTDLKYFVEHYGFLPRDPFAKHGLTLFTSFLLHGSWLHLLGNLYFLALFSPEVEAEVGILGFLSVLVMSTAMCELVSIPLADHIKSLPHIGASGGIFGVLVFHVLAFPKEKVILGIFNTAMGYPSGSVIRISAYHFLWLILAFQVVGTGGQLLSGHAEIDFIGHLGGGLGGLLSYGAYLVIKARTRPRQPNI